MEHRRLAAILAEELGLDLPPVALAFRDAAPQGVAASESVVPSACAFWRQAEAGVFFAAAARHANCPIGAFVMGFELAPETLGELQAAIGRMTACGYVDPEEPARIPTRRQNPKGVLYGPLADFPVPPDAVLVWVAPHQAMVWSEASGGAIWGGAAPQTVFGRPACAAIPKAIDTGAPTLSLGCIGMRTFTRIPVDRMLAVVPGPRLADFADALARAATANRSMEKFYAGRLEALGKA